MVSLLSIAYHAMIPEEPNLIECPNFNLVRKWIGPSRIYTFLWKLSHEKFLTNAERKHRCMLDTYVCPRCSQAPETIMHVLRDYDLVKNVCNEFLCLLA